MKTAALDRLDPLDIPARRSERFFGTGSAPDRGICAGFERIGDPLWQADEIARVLADRVPSGYCAVIERFKLSVKAGKFGPSVSRGRFATPEALSYDQRHRAETTRNLIDLDSAVLRPPEPGQYTLRPSILVASDFALYMRARQSVWAHWIASQGWPVPPEFVAPVPEPPSPKREGYMPWLRALVTKHPEMPTRELAIWLERECSKARASGRAVPDLPKQRRSLEKAIERIREVREKRKQPQTTAT